MWKSAQINIGFAKQELCKKYGKSAAETSGNDATVEH
jgi:hypothetical protein